MPFEENEIEEQDANELQESSTEDSSPSESESQNDGEVEETQQEPEPQAAQAASEPPFHEHPRFKEIIEEKNSLQRRVEEMQQEFQERMEQIQQAQEASTKKEDPLFERLDSIDPEFAGKFREIYQNTQAAQTQLQQFQEWQQAQQNEAIANRFYSEVDGMVAEAKVPEALHDVYRLEMETIAKNNPHLDFQDLPKVFNDVHQKWQTRLDGLSRAQKQQYVQSVKKSAATLKYLAPKYEQKASRKASSS